MKFDFCRSEKLPLAGNLMLADARVACLCNMEPKFRPVETRTAKDLPDAGLNLVDTVSLRILAVQQFTQKRLFDLLLEAPQKCLRLLNRKEKELKTNSWSRQDGILTGYARVPSKLVSSFLSSSGVNGVFVQPLAKDSVVHRPVKWYKPELNEDPVKYWTRVKQLADVDNHPLAFRHGGGACLGALDVVDEEIRNKAWAACNVPFSWGPSTLESWLVQQGWRVESRPLPPRRKNGHWAVQGYPENFKECGTDDLIYDVKTDERCFNITLRCWKKRRVLTAEPARIEGPKWFLPDDPIETPESQPPMELDEASTQKLKQGSNVLEEDKGEKKRGKPDEPPASSSAGKKSL